MGKNVTLINPGLVTQADDSLGSGIPYMPIPLAYLAGSLKRAFTLNVIDAFGEDPFRVRRKGNSYVQGLEVNDILKRIGSDADYLVIYYSTVMANNVIAETIKGIKEDFPLLPVIVIENPEAVIGCPLEHIADDLFKDGADYLVFGESEMRAVKLIQALDKGDTALLKDIDGIAYRARSGEIISNPKHGYIENIDVLDFPTWEYFPLKNYWKLGYAHGPMEGKYLAIMTSRGCPFNCNFCVIPATNGRKWRGRSPENVVAEIEYMKGKYGVSEFHWEDVNPTADEKRIEAICELLSKKGLKVKWKLASGSKIETMSLKTLELMRKAGCNYISFSPESGSGRLLKLMNKPFNHDYALKMTGHMHRIGIRSQACFVLGFPGETDEDIDITRSYVRELAKAGIDEIALFIMTPIPGTKTFGQLTGFKDYSELTFSPSWRKDFGHLNDVRRGLYFHFLIQKMMHHPFKLLKQLFNLLFRKFESKAEMNIYRMLRLRSMVRAQVKGA